MLLSFPGIVHLPPAAGGEEEEEERTGRAVREAQEYGRDLNTVWTNGSRLDSGGVGGAVAWYEEVPHGAKIPPPFADSVEDCLASARGQRRRHIPTETGSDLSAKLSPGGDST